MTKRFKRYKFALKANDGGAAAGSALEKFNKWQTGETKVTYERGAGSLPKEFSEVNILPFALGDDTILYPVPFSKRTSDWSGAEAIIAVCHHEAKGQTDVLVETTGFISAKAIVRAASTGTAEKVSKITGVSYKSLTGANSYTFPFGRKKGGTAAQVLFSAGAAAIKTVVVGAEDNTGRSVTFTPEKFPIA